MKRSFKTRLTAVMAIIAFCSLVFGVALFTNLTEKAYAVTPSAFEMLGMSIRYSNAAGDDGIRFGVKLDLTTYNTLIADDNAVAGILITPSDMVNGAELNLWTAAASKARYGILYNGATGVNQWTVKSSYAEGIVYLHGFPEASYNRPITAIAYIDWNNDGNSSTVNHSDSVQKSMSDIALAITNDYNGSNAFGTTAEQAAKLGAYLLSYNVEFLDEYGNEYDTQTKTFGSNFDFPSDPGVVDGRTFLGWQKRVGGTSTPVWSNGLINKAAEDTTVKKAVQYKAYYQERVSHTTTLYNKENIYGADPSVTYRNGFYYYVTVDSSNKILVRKSRSLEELLEGGDNGWGDGTNFTTIYDPTNTSSANYNSALAKKIWAPELEYLNGNWYIYVSGCSASSDGGTMSERMFVLECNSQDPSGSWKTPVKLEPSVVSGKYAIDGHAFYYKNQLYYTFSGRTVNSETSSPRIFICTMNSPTSVNNDAVNISKNSKLEEGPCTLVDGDDLYLMYSVGNFAGSLTESKDYHVDYYKCSNKNPMSASNWTQGGTAIWRSTSNNVYCTGHNHVFKNADGSYWTSYHGVVGTDDIGTDDYLAKRRVFVQPISVSGGVLSFGGVKATVSITDEGGLFYNDYEKTEYATDGYGSARLWENSGKSFTVSTTITRVSGTDQFCGGITLYQREGDGYLSRLLIGVEKEGNIFFCKDYARDPYKYKYVGWLFDNEGAIDLKVSYTAGTSASNSMITIKVSNRNGSQVLTRSYSLAEINALVSDTVPNSDPASKSFNLHFTGNFRIGLGGNLNKCSFTNVLFYCNDDVELNWNDSWGDTWTPN